MKEGETILNSIYFVRENHKPEGKLMGETRWGELGTKSTEQKKRSSVFM